MAVIRASNQRGILSECLCISKSKTIVLLLLLLLLAHLSSLPDVWSTEEDNSVVTWKDAHTRQIVELSYMDVSLWQYK